MVTMVVTKAFEHDTSFPCIVLLETNFKIKSYKRTNILQRHENEKYQNIENMTTNLLTGKTCDHFRIEDNQNNNNNNNNNLYCVQASTCL